MAWTKVKTAIVVGVVAVLAAGSTTVTLRAISNYREDSVWSHITAIDSRQLDAAPPTVSIRSAKFGRRAGSGSVSTDQRKMLGSAASMATLLSAAYEISDVRIVNAEALPKGNYDFIVSLRSHQLEGLQGAIKKKFGLVAKRETRETNVLIFKVAKPDAPGLKPSFAQNSGSSSRSNTGELDYKNTPVSNLASSLEYYFHTPVIDETDLKGRYDLHLTWSEPGGYQNPNPEGLKQAILDNLGLELTPATRPIEMLVVEKVK